MGDACTRSLATGSYGDHIPPITAAHPRGYVLTSPQTVGISTNEPATIYYTTDGSTPTTSSTVYTSPFQVSTTTVLKFFAIDDAENKGKLKTEFYIADFDSDGIISEEDNCPITPNGPDQGTCTSGDPDRFGRPCMNDSECGIDGFCSMNQEETYLPGNGGIGDACYLCESDFDFDSDVDGTDAAAFKQDFGRNTYSNPCVDGNPCTGDFSCDHDVDGSDASLFKEDFGRNIYYKPCPASVAGEWCNYM